jgi:hypothetical protein
MVDALTSTIRTARRRLEQTHVRRALAGWRADAAFALAFFLIGCALGFIYVDRVGQGSYYQQEFGPAVMQACGHGFTEYHGDPALRRFLADRADGYECPVRFDEAQSAPASSFAVSERYLFAAASFLWWVSGVSWAALIPLFAVLYGVTVAGLYGVFRLAARPLVASMGAVTLMFSPLYLNAVPQLRDFAKAPFIVVGLFLVGLLLARRFSTGQLAAIGAGLGATMGVGFGFRVDALVIVPLFLLALALFMPGGLRPDWRGRLASLGAFTAVFSIAAIPIIVQTPSGGGNMSFVAIHGLTDPFDRNLGVEQDLYSPGYLYNDSYATGLVNAFAYRIEGHRQPVVLATAEMEHYSRALYLRFARAFPADLYVRSRGAFQRLLELGAWSTKGDSTVPRQVDPGGVVAAARNALGDGLRRLGGPLLLPFLAFVLLATRRPRVALFVALSVAFAAMVSTVQYDLRHVFHLELVWWLAAAFLAEQAARAVPHIAGAVDAARAGVRLDTQRWRDVVVHASLRAVPVLLVVGAFAALDVPLRNYQNERVESLFELYESAPRLNLPTRESQAGEGRTLVRVGGGDEVWRGAPGGMTSALLVARFDLTRCPFIAVNAVARYEADDPYDDWSQPIDLRRSVAGPARVDLYFLAFRHQGGSFAGFELPTDQSRCLASVRAVDTQGLPLLLYATLPDDWRAVTRYETLAGTEHRRQVYTSDVEVLASGLAVPSITPFDAATPTAYRWNDLAYVQDDVRVQDRSFSYDGDDAGRFAYLIQTKPGVLPMGHFVVVRGVLQEGGLTIGLLRNDAWATTVNVTSPGEFYAVLESPANAHYAFVIANNVSGDDAHSAFRVEAAQWGLQPAEAR